MSWEYRIVKRTYHRPSGDFVEYGIHEYYSPQEMGGTGAITVSPVSVVADDKDGVGVVLEQMGAALKKPVLTYEDFEEKEK